MKTSIYPVRVEFGDCDPARIVWYPNFYRWMDAASRYFFQTCGLPTWTETERERGILGTPVVDIHCKFIRTATYGEQLEIHTHVAEWRSKSFVMVHRIQRGDVLIAEGTDVRIFAGRKTEDPEKIYALPIPQDIRALCS